MVRNGLERYQKDWLVFYKGSKMLFSERLKIAMVLRNLRGSLKPWPVRQIGQRRVEYA